MWDDTFTDADPGFYEGRHRDGSGDGVPRDLVSLILAGVIVLLGAALAAKGLGW